MNQLTIRGNNFYYKDLHQDCNEVILLVHGHPFDHSMWSYQYEALKDFRLILPDLKGYGQSDYNLDKIFIEDQALDLALLLDELEIDQVHLIGLSMGGQIIVEFTRLFPARVKSLVICASTPKAETASSYNKRMELAASIQKTGMEAYTKTDIDKYINISLHGENSAVYQHLYEMMSNTKKEGAVASHKGRALRRDNFPFLKSIRVPTLVIAGEKDYFFEKQDVQAVAHEIPGAKFEVIKNTGHLPNMENPEVFNNVLLGFYSEQVI